MSHLENFNHFEKEKNFDLGGLRLQIQKNIVFINVILNFQTFHCTINILKYLSGILSDEKKSGLRVVSESVGVGDSTRT